MPRRLQIDPEEALNNGIKNLAINLPAESIRKHAKQSGFVIREKKIDASLFLWNLVLGFGSSMQKTLAALKKRYCVIAAEELAPSSFFERFTPKLVAFLHAVLQDLLASTVRSELPRKILERFQDVLIIDSTIVRLLDTLAKIFPGAGMPAGVKISTILSVATSNLHRMTIHAGKRAEVKTLRLGEWVRNNLLLFDMGYFKFAVFDRIIALGGHFITRLHENADPTIVSLNRTCRGNAITLVGKKLRDCLSFLKREVLDVQVKVNLKRRIYRGKQKIVPLVLRLVGILNPESQEYHLYLTDLPPETFSPEQIADLYRGRWCVELLFKELKSRYALDIIRTEKPEIVEALIYSAMITLVVSRRLFVGYRDAMAKSGQKVTADRWARFFVEYAGILLRRVLKASGIEYSESILLSMALKETVSPDPHRESLEDVWDV